MTDTVYQWEILPTATIFPYENNPRSISEAAVEAVAESIKEYGWQQPLVVWKNPESDKIEIVVGHTRLQAAKLLGQQTVPCKIANDLTAEQVAAYRIIDNKSGEHTEWNFELLQTELEMLDLTSDVFKANFSPIELDTIMQASWAPKTTEEHEALAKSADNTYTLKMNTIEFTKLVAVIEVMKKWTPDITDGQCLLAMCEEWLETHLTDDSDSSGD